MTRRHRHPHPLSPRRRDAVLAALVALVLVGCSTPADDDVPAPTADDAPSQRGTWTSVTPGTSWPALPGDGPVGGTATTAAVPPGAPDGTPPPEDVLAPKSPWNLPVTDAPIAADSATLLDASANRTVAGPGGELVEERVEAGLHLDAGAAAGAVPVVSGGVDTVLRCRQDRCGDGIGDLTVPVPADVDPDPLSNGWFTVIDESTDTAYDLLRARREDDRSISYHLMRRWDLDGPGFSRPYVAGAHGSGLPLFAGLVRPGELERCEIEHALAIGLPGPAAGYFVQPASTTDGDNPGDAVPAGARLRLRADVVAQPPTDPLTGEPVPFSDTERERADCLVTALQRYGAVVVGRAPVPTLYVERPDPDGGRPAVLRGDELASLGLQDFEVLDLSGATRFPYPPTEATSQPGAS